LRDFPDFLRCLRLIPLLGEVLAMAFLHDRPVLGHAVRAFGLALLVPALQACSATPWYYSVRNVDYLTVGDTREVLEARFAPERRDANGRRLNVEGLRVRASHTTEKGDLIEIGEVVLMKDDRSATMPYWLFFENGRLTRWAAQPATPVPDNSHPTAGYYSDGHWPAMPVHGPAGHWAGDGAWSPTHGPAYHAAPVCR
jgi:hypothetical protein